MEIQPWMLAAYMIGGICFFIFISTKIMPYFTKRAIMKGLRSQEGKDIMKEVVLQGIQALNDEIEVPGPPDESGKPTKIKTTIGDIVMAQVGSAVVQHFKMTFLGEKGNLSREVKALAVDGMIAGLPENMQGMGAMLAPLLRKYPVLGAFIGMAQMYQAQKSNAQQPGRMPGGSVPTY